MHAGTCAQVQDVAGIVERLLGFLDTGRPHVTAEALLALKDLLRRYPALADACLASLSSLPPEVLLSVSSPPGLGLHAQLSLTSQEIAR
jgi:hypothetical protein